MIQNSVQIWKVYLLGSETEVFIVMFQLQIIAEHLEKSIWSVMEISEYNTYIVFPLNVFGKVVTYSTCIFSHEVELYQVQFDVYIQSVQYNADIISQVEGSVFQNELSKNLSLSQA